MGHRHRKAAFGLELTAEEEQVLAPSLEAADRYVKLRTGGEAN